MNLRFAVLIPLVFVAGCQLTTTQPLSDPDTTEADESLYGHWVTTKETGPKESVFHLFIGKHTVEDNPASLMELAVVDWGPEKLKLGAVPNKLYFSVSRIGKTSYCNLCINSKVDLDPMRGDPTTPDLSETGSYRYWAAKDKRRRYAILRYVCDGKTLRIWTVSRGAVDQFVKDKKLESLDDTESGVTIESLKKYLQKNDGAALFDHEIVTATKAR